MGDKPKLSGLVIEPAGPGEMRDGAAIFARAMGRRGALVVAWLFQFSQLLAESGVGRFLAARYQHKTVGYCSLSVYEQTGWIGFMATEPAFQRRGIGAALMEHVLGLAEELGLKTLKLDATSIGRKLYTRFGFREEYPAGMHEMPGVCTRGTCRDGPGGRVKLSDHMPGWCMALDRRAFGDDRTPLLRRALQDGAKLLLIENRAYGLVDGKKLGPLIAGDLDAALAIRHSASGLGVSHIYVPHHGELPHRFLEGLLKREEEGPITCCTRMSKGKALRQELRLTYADYSAATG